MNLVIDIGNTRTKYSIFNQGKEVLSKTVKEFAPNLAKDVKQDYPELTKVILSSVKDYPSVLRKALQSQFSTFIELNAETPLPIENCYASKATLGKDRIAAVVGAFHLYPKTNVLVIDAGTAITFDLLTSNGKYLGGNIAPGLEMRFKALNQYTHALPLVKKANYNQLYGTTTETAILAGVQNGLVYETDKCIDAFKEFYGNLEVIITGGDAEFFDNKLKNSFFVHFNLTGLGLNRILQHNGESK
jgi:type III pantothenate kinase